MKLEYEKVTVTIDRNEAFAIRNALIKGIDHFKNDPKAKPAKQFYNLLDGFQFARKPPSDQ